ncbi:MAG: hypothetical protein N3F08_06875, partial [Crenarchaeota archaeon]|nr:hypothetical protein [Thermoproteota archaeon]
KNLRELESFFTKDLHLGRAAFRRDSIPLLRLLSKNEDFRRSLLNRLVDQHLKELYSSIILGEARKRFS